MLDQIVHHLRTHNVPFRLSSQPSAEPLPSVAHPVPPGGLMVETQVLVVGGRAAVAAMPQGAKLSLPMIRHALGADVIEGVFADLPPPYSRAAGHIPPLGSGMGVVTIVDERVAAASPIVFLAFSPFDCVELPYDDFARLEHPRIASFAIGGELPAGQMAQDVEKKVA
jgi:hypothetical protein